MEPWQKDGRHIVVRDLFWCSDHAGSTNAYCVLNI